MTELMEFIYNYLSTFAPTFYKDLERNDKGEVNIDGVSITYEVENSLSDVENHAKMVYPLSIKIWGRKCDYPLMVDMIDDIDKWDRCIYSCEKNIYYINKSNTFMINITDFDKYNNVIRLNYNITEYK